MAFQGIGLAGLFFGCESGHWEDGESGGYPVAQYLDGLAGSVGLDGLIHHIRGALGDLYLLFSPSCLSPPGVYLGLFWY